MSTAAPRIRRSLTDIQKDYDAGDRAELENLMRAWKGIKELPADDLNSFFMIGGYHGEPFRGPGETDPAWWGGYCQHGTVLFPTWHRAYLHRLEQALRSIPGCEEVTLPFWDECSEESRSKGIPPALTDPTFELDGETIPNPLRSFVFPEAIVDQVDARTSPAFPDLYSKPAGYETVRYPLSGLVGTPDARATTAAHNALYADPQRAVAILNDNIVNWLTATVAVPVPGQGHVHDKFLACLDAPDYTLFSNTTSAAAHNKANPGKLVVPLESPHNSIHLAVGGFDLPGVVDLSPIAGANGDMGENDTAGLDPIFFFHHCFIDYVFWIWQRRHGAVDGFAITAGDPGASYVLGGNNQPPAGAGADDLLTVDTPLKPFMKASDADPSGMAQRFMATSDVFNIETQLGYAYGPGSLDGYANASPLKAAAAPEAVRTLHVAGLDRARIPGSFLIATFADVGGQRTLIGHEAVLSRWDIEGCANCQNHLRVTADFRVAAEHADAGDVQVEVHTHDGPLGGPVRPFGSSLLATDAEPPAFTVEVR